MVPLGLLLAGSLVGLPFSLDAAVAWERLIGIVLAGAVGVAALWGLRRLPDRRVPMALVLAGSMALLAGLWLIAVVGADVFRGPVGAPLQRVFGPLYGHVALTDPVAVTNTRFIVGYNGLADLCLVACFAGGAALLARPWGVALRVMGGLLLALGLVLLLGSGSRGGLSGLVAGAWLVSPFLARRGWLLGLAGVPLLIGLAMAGVLDKGLDLSSTLGRFEYWRDLARLLTEFPLTGVGLGVDTANRVALQYEINPDPERIAYAHNTFVQTYLESGPLGVVGMVLLPLGAFVGAVLVARRPLSRGRRALLAAGLGLTVAFETHGLTDQVLTTNVGTGLLVLAVATTLAALSPWALGRVQGLMRWTGAGALALALLTLAATAIIPSWRAQVLLNLGGLQLNQALLRDAAAPSQPDRAALAQAEGTLGAALALVPEHPAVLRDLARARNARFDVGGAVDAIQAAAGSPRLDAFDMLQIAHVYRDLGFTNEAYTWAARAYTTWDRPQNAYVILTYKEATLPDDFRVRTLAAQGEAAMRARRFDEALPLFLAARAFAPKSTYLLDRIGDAERGVYREQVRGEPPPS